jgi:hypothetical protein
MANKKVSQLTSKPAVNLTDLFLIADPTSGQAFKTTISDLGTAIGSGVSSVNTLVGAVVLDTDDIQELASPTNRWFTDTRARAALSASSPLAYNSGTGVFSIPAATSSQDGYLTSADWTTFNAKQAALSGTGFVKISGTTISYDNSTYLTTSAAASTYLALAGGTLTGALNGTSATFTGDLTLSATNPRLYFTDTDNNPDYFISNTDGTFTIYDVTNSQSRFTIGTTGNGTFGGNLTVGQIIRSGGTSAEFLKADGSVDSSVYALDSAVVKLTGNQTVAGIKTMSNVFKLDDTLQIKNIAQLSNNTGYTGVWAETAAIGFYTGANAIRLLYAGNYNYTMPSADGTLALTSDLSAYLPLTGGVLSGSLRSSGYYLTGMTSGSGALYYNAGANRITIANYNASGILDFEVNGGTSALTLNADLSANFKAGASFAGAVTTTGGTRSIQLVSFASDYNYIRSNGAPLVFGTQDSQDLFIQTNNTTRLTFVGGTGAATFTSSIDVNSYIRNTNVGANAAVTIAADGTSHYIQSTNAARTVYNNLLLNPYGGNVGIGSTTAEVPFEIHAGRTTNPPSLGSKGGTIAMLFNDSANGSYGLLMGLAGANVYLQNQRTDANATAYNLLLQPNGGLVGIGRTNPEFLLDVNGDIALSRFNKLQFTGGTVGDRNRAYIAGNGNNDLIFAVAGGAEMLRMHNSGNLLLGTQDNNGGRLQVFDNVDANTIISRNTGSGFAATLGFFAADRNTTNNTFFFLRCYNYGSSTYRFNVADSGNVTNANNSYGAISDIKLKENISDATSKLSDLLKIKVKNFNFIGNNEKQLGVIAQEVEEIFPGLVEINKDRDGDGNDLGTVTKSVKYSVFVPMLIKAVQELSDKITTLENK